MRPTSIVLSLAMLSTKSTAAQVCSTAVNTLSTACGYDVCGAYEPCLAYNITDCSSTGSTDSSSCTTIGDDMFSYHEHNDRDGIYATANNQMVVAIDQLTLSPQTTSVWIEGGDYRQINRGKVVELELADNLLTSQSQVTSVSLVTMDLSSRIYDMPKMMPNSITELSLSNSLLTKFPEFLSSLTNLLILHLNDSYITFVHSSVYWEKLTVMDLQRNSFTTFEGNFPGLTLPYLNDNNLTEIPEIVFTFQHLTNFRIHNNSLLTRSFTEAQITFLQRLDGLDLAESDFQSAADCSLSEQRVTGDRNVVVCVSNPSTTQASSPSSASTESSDSSAPSVPIAGVSHSSGSDDDDSSTSVSLLVSILIVVLVALTVTAIYYRNQRKKRDVEWCVQPHAQSFEEAASYVHLRSDNDLLALQDNHDDIHDIRVIGIVWLVRYRNSVLLASKRLREDTERAHAFDQEIKLVSRLDHPTIVSLIGAAWTTGSDIQALFELVENGHLSSYLSPSLPRYWTRVKLQLAVDVIEALVYIHAFTPPQVHRNLNSHNVLLTTDMPAKLTDVSALGSQSTNRWLAPEVISGTSDYEQAADIFAFGVLLAGFDTHMQPYEDAASSNDNTMDVLQMVASGNLRPVFSDTCPPIILELAKQYMSQEPCDHPPAL
ncbi:Protein tyrosine kinase [Phytophthora infestans]|uniref:Protein tyrosine kinase n=1 Tax=Phytophthora infestans TaxID=4787 RepID=A0A8S9TJU9_PHYIN|nr:Protein tyrosine kinase [Phytophthora infestans]